MTPNSFFGIRNNHWCLIVLLFALSSPKLQATSSPQTTPTTDHFELLTQTFFSLLSNQAHQFTKLTGLSSKACPSHPGLPDPDEFEECTGNVRVVVPIPFASTSLIYNSTVADRNYGMGPGWSLSLDARIYLTANPVIVHGDQTTIALVALPAAGLGNAQVFPYAPLNPRHNEPLIEFNSRRNLAFQRFAEGDVHQYVRMARNRNVFLLSSITDKFGNQIEIVRDQSLNGVGQILELKLPFNRSNRFFYNSSGKLTQIQSYRGLDTTLEYHSTNGMLSFVRRPDQTYWEMNYQEPFAWLSRIKTPRGVITQFSYWVNGIVQQKTSPQGNVTTYHHGLDRTVVEDSEAVQTFTFDSNGRAVGVTTRLKRGESIGSPSQLTLQRDSMGRLTTILFPNGLRRTISYLNESPLVVAKRTFAPGATTPYESEFYYRNSANQLTQQRTVSPGGIQDTYFDPAQFGRITRTRVEATGGIADFSYIYTADRCQIIQTSQARQIKKICWDVNGYLASVTDAAGLVTQFTFREGRLVSKRDPMGLETQFEYDSHGFLIGENIAGQVQKRLTRDESGRVTESIFQGPSGIIHRNTFTQDSFPNGAIQRVTSSSNHNGNFLLSKQIEFESPEASTFTPGRVISEQTTFPGGRVYTLSP